MRAVPATATLLMTLLLSVLAAACGSSGGGSGAGTAVRHRAAEPATAPQTTTAPAGTTHEVAPGPQGIVYDKLTNSLAVAVHDPYRLLVLDPTTLRTKLAVRLPGQARHLQVSHAGGTALVGSETASTLVEVDLRTGSARSTKVQRHPHDAAGVANGDVLVGNELSGSMSVVRGGKVVHTFSDLRQPGGVIAAGSTAAVVDVRGYTVTTYDLRTMKRTGRIAAGAGPTHGVLVRPDTIVVTDTRGGHVLVDTLHPLKQVGSLRLAGSPYGLAADPASGTAWVTLTGKNELVGLDVSGSTPEVIARYPTVRQPDTVAVAPGAKTLWVAGTHDGVVQRITR